MKMIYLLLLVLLLLTGCGKYGYHEVPDCNTNMTVTASGQAAFGSKFPYWYELDGFTGYQHPSFQLIPVGTEVCVYVE